MTPGLALDTSVAVPLLVARHPDHAALMTWWAGRSVVLSGHAAVETYGVLTRLPGDARLVPRDAARLLASWFGPPLLLGLQRSIELPDFLAARSIAGGATCDALVALAAVEHGVELATRDARARPTYEAVGARILLAG